MSDVLKILLTLTALAGGPIDSVPPDPVFANDTPPEPTFVDARSVFTVRPPLTWSPGAPVPVIGYRELLERAQRGERLSVGFGVPPCPIDGWTPVRCDDSVFQGCKKCWSPDGAVDPVMEAIITIPPIVMPGPAVPVVPFTPPPAAQPSAASLTVGVRPAGLSKKTGTIVATPATWNRPPERALGLFGGITRTARTITNARGAVTGGDISDCVG